MDDLFMAADGRGPFFTYLQQQVVNNIFQTDEEDEKYKKMYQKKQKRYIT